MSAGSAARGVVLPALFVAVGACACWSALGTWQLERKAWKEALIAALDSARGAAPTDLPPRERWPRARCRRGRIPPRRVSGASFCTARRRWSTPPARRCGDVTGPGYWVFTPARLAGGSIVVVNRGFVPEAGRTRRRARGQPAGTVDIVGVLRWPEQRGTFTPADEPANAISGSRAIQPRWRRPRAGARSRRSTSIRKRRRRPAACRRAGRSKPSLPNNHLQYALTWFGLALVVLVRGRCFCASHGGARSARSTLIIHA